MMFRQDSHRLMVVLHILSRRVSLISICLAQRITLFTLPAIFDDKAPNYVQSETEDEDMLDDEAPKAQLFEAEPPNPLQSEKESGDVLEDGVQEGNTTDDKPSSSVQIVEKDEELENGTLAGTSGVQVLKAVEAEKEDVDMLQEEEPKEDSIHQEDPVEKDKPTPIQGPFQIDVEEQKATSNDVEESVFGQGVLCDASISQQELPENQDPFQKQNGFDFGDGLPQDDTTLVLDSIFGNDAAVCSHVAQGEQPPYNAADFPLFDFEKFSVPPESGTGGVGVNAIQKNATSQDDDTLMEDVKTAEEVVFISDDDGEASDDSADAGSLYQEGSELEEDVEIEESPPPEPSMEYNLRDSARIGRQAYLTWIDDDETGDYDPKVERARNRKEFKRLVQKSHQKIASFEDGEDDEERLFDERVDRLSYAAARQNGISFVFTFKFECSTGKELVNSIPDSWPETTWNVLSDEYVSAITSEMNRDPDAGLPWKLRQKRSGEPLHDSISDGTQTTDSRNSKGIKPIIPDPAGLKIDLFGHPEARGCVQCRELQHPCTLVDDNGTWPCFACLESGEDQCELIITPKHKLNCKECRRKKLQCSYYDDGSDTSRPCLQCDEAGTVCIAGPAPKSRKRISYDKDYSQPQKPTQDCRPYVQCTACRSTRGKTRCSLRSHYDYPPCSSCKKAGQKCTFDPIPTTSRSKGKKPIPQSTHEWIRTPQPDANGTIPASVHGIPGHQDLKKLSADTRLFRTKFHHPIKFFYVPSTEQVKDDHPCTFCSWRESPYYSIVGIADRQVLVRPMDSQGLSYRETKTLISAPTHYANHQPYNPQGKDRPTLMCVSCCMQRAYIVGCTGHEMRPLETVPVKDNPRAEEGIEIDQKKFDVRAMYKRLHQFGKGPLKTDMWCSLCISPGIHRCCTPQDGDMWGADIRPPTRGKRQRPHDSLGAIGIKAGDGCGLLLCDECYSVLIDCDGDLEMLIDEVQKDTERKIWVLGERADADFLRRDGLLMKNLFATGS